MPDQSIILKGQEKKDAGHITAFRDGANSYVMIYMPVGRKVEIDMLCLHAKNTIAWWFDPRTGKAKKIGLFGKRDKMWFVPPVTGIKNDWVLVVDDAVKEYKSPGI